MRAQSVQSMRGFERIRPVAGRLKWALTGFSLACLASLALSAADTSPPATTTPPPTPAAVAAPAAGPQIIKVGVYVLNLGKFDIASGSFSIDFYLSLRSDRAIPETWEFLNGRAGSIEKITDTPNEKFYRILANLTSPIDLRRFPFDQQQLQIVLEDKEHNESELRFEPDAEQTAFDEAVTIPGWEMTGFTTKVGSHPYPAYKEVFSQYAFQVGIGRIKVNSFIKTFLPVLFLMLIMVSSFILNPEQIVTRMATISSSLVASAMFHISIASQIPPVAYLTFADKFMLVTYFILLGSFFLNIGIFLAQNKKNTERANRLSRWSSHLVFVGVPALYLILFLVVS